MSILQRVITCPICHLPLAEVPQRCDTCLDYFRNELEKAPSSLIDLTPDAVQRQIEGNAAETKPLRTELFRSPIISFFYERILPPIWAMGLRNLGGIDVEFQQCTEFFGEDPEIVVDISCGTGIMARRLALLGKYEQIIALDYSESMLAQLQQQMKLDGISPSQITIIRGDVEALPLASDSVDAIYAGAAMHCWPNAEAGIRNIYQVLRKGGKLFATTFLKPLPSIVFRFFTVDELRQILLTTGFHLDHVQVEAHGLYGIIRCVK
ncbi:class I SAM-dependent methyltransferase [Nostoc sp. CENA67]|uniref:Class I SAM-dependent methyltransferase n=1 Tax=Amazonocrinis nigriterrae CENA67 TaxID=2794033 RepID=A0A8J7L9Q7_9NOST|nr:class I SAM-dependent methyltransferase [Amazonocrinis nigriterrae]MBH8564385.1 class I SAM-dependent methyltransferase [Amazonocrinis nigriterrae CENA67]